MTASRSIPIIGALKVHLKFMVPPTGFFSAAPLKARVLGDGGEVCVGGINFNQKKIQRAVRGFDEMFGKRVEVPRIRHGSGQALETLINEEALLLAKYLRGEAKYWTPRIAFLG
jgi:hypothetical protein